MGRLCHTVLAPSEPSKASLGKEMLYARAAGRGMPVLRLFSERQELIELLTGKGDNKVHRATPMPDVWQLLSLSRQLQGREHV